MEGGRPALVSGACQDKAVPIGSRGRWPYTLLEPIFCCPKVPHPPGMIWVKNRQLLVPGDMWGTTGLGYSCSHHPAGGFRPEDIYLSLIQAPRCPLSPLGSRCLWQAQLYLRGLSRGLQKVPSHRTQVATCDVANVWLAVTYKTSSEPGAA